ncbi:phage distal tail protein, Rcc01695 family [Phreatobacter sp.]|uniref:phage distal tail protein, Rcc01695 family n=1 Tax=Phreatobacter sp. TaxID=1966341 RepID=UPI003F6EB1F3
MSPFHEVLFPLDVALGASGGPERLTDIVRLGSGREERNARWAHSRRRYDAGYGVKTLGGLQAVVAFFEERRGRLHGFRFRDPLDHASGPPGAAPSPTDQPIGTGDGETVAFALARTYGAGPAAYVRPIVKPVAATVRVAIGGVETEDFALDPATGLVTFASPPGEGAAITAGFLFDVPVRFDTDRLEVNLTSFAAGEIPSIPLIEIRV